MQTVTLKIKLLPPNKGKLEKMTRMLEIYRQACFWFLEKAEALNTTSRAHLNRETYRQACELFDLNRGTLQCAMLKALSVRRSYLSRKQRLQEVQPHDVGLELSGAGFIHRIQGRPCRGARNLRRPQGEKSR